MSRGWVTSDWHLWHVNLLTGRKIGIRPFDSVDEMHEAILQGMVDAGVKSNDKLYMLGDLTLMRPGKDLTKQFQQIKELRDFIAKVPTKQLRLVLGNHDYWPVEFYQALGFEKVLAMRTMGGAIISHIPVHPSQFERFKGNIHGHTHERDVRHPDTLVEDGWGFPEPRSIDTRYFNACLEVNNYRPVLLDEVLSRWA